MTKQEKIRRKHEAKKAKKAKKFQAKNNASADIKFTNFGPVTMMTCDDSKCLRILGYDAFDHFGLTHDEVDFISSIGNWTCWSGINDNSRYSFDGQFFGTSDEEFVLLTARDVFAVAIGKGLGVECGLILGKMIDADRALAEKLFIGPTLKGKATCDWLDEEIARVHQIFTYHKIA